MTDCRPVRRRVAAVCAASVMLAVAMMSEHGTEASERTSALTAVSATMATGQVIEGRMTGKLPRRAMPRRKVSRHPVPRRARRKVPAPPGAPNHVRGYDVKHRLPPGTSASGRRIELDHMGAYNFTVEIE